jgi:hypothetical protein
MQIDWSDLIAALNAAATAFLPLVSVFGVLAGVYLIASVGKQLLDGTNGTMYDDPKWTALLVRIFVAAMLLSFSTTLQWNSDLLAGTGSGTRDAMALVVKKGNPFWDAVMNASFKWLNVMGAVGVFRGLLKLNEAATGDNRGGGSDPFWAAMWHLIGGTLLFNMAN